MTTSQLCLFIVAALPFSMTFLAKARKGYDNRAPRDYLAKLEGWRARAQAAHQNGWKRLRCSRPRWWWHGTTARTGIASTSLRWHSSRSASSTC